MASRPFRRSLLVAGAALASAAALLPVTAEAAPPGWTSPQPLPNTSGLVNEVSATAPDGTDAVLWVGRAGDQVAIRGRVRAAGSNNWKTLQPYVTDAAQDLALAGDRHGNFAVAWVRYNARDVPQVRFARLDGASATLSTPKEPFDDQRFGHLSPRVAVSSRGTVFVATGAKPKKFSSPPKYRAEVGIKRPGEPWDTRFLSPADKHAVVTDLAVSPNGHAVVGFIQGYGVAETRVRAATRPAGASSTWTVSTISAAGDGQSATVAVGPGGMAAVQWAAPSGPGWIIRLAYRDVTTADDWVTTNLSVAGNYVDQGPVVDPDGNITGFFSDSLIWARQVQGGVVLAVHAVSPPGVTSSWRALQMGNGGLAALVYQRFDTDSTNLGLRFRWVDHGVAGPEMTLTGTGDGSVNGVGLGLDAADHVNVVWTAGDYPDTDFRSMGNPPAAPSVVSAPYFGDPVTKATAKGHARAGRVLTCETGYVVEANDVKWRWYRNGDRITGETGHRYRLRDADSGKRVRCAMVATGRSDSTRLTSPVRHVR